MLTGIQVGLLRRISPGEPTQNNGMVYAGKCKLRTLLGDELLEKIAGKTVIDFGCGDGIQAVQLAKVYGARRVIGVESQSRFLDRARQNARAAQVDSICTFAETTAEQGDVVLSIDAFEHFEDPAAILETMHGMLKPGGIIIGSFGPTWYHPLGGHLFSVFPWAHLLFSEDALLRWRADFKNDGARRFSDVAGGLNQITIARFEAYVRNSPFELTSLTCVPIRKLARIHNRLTREFTTAVVRCELTKRARTGEQKYAAAKA